MPTLDPADGVIYDRAHAIAVSEALEACLKTGHLAGDASCKDPLQCETFSCQSSPSHQTKSLPFRLRS
jgi:hypothetical protein